MIPSIICVISILAQVLLVRGECLEECKECLEVNNLTIDDMKHYKFGDKISKPQLCVFKCICEKLGTLEPDGTINFVELEKHPKFIILSDSDKEKSKTCLKKLPKIMECVDMQNVLDCFADMDF